MWNTYFFDLYIAAISADQDCSTDYDVTGYDSAIDIEIIDIALISME